MQRDAPIIIVGAGRSGSTLLDRMLDSHPDIHMFGETEFLIATLWKYVLEIRERSLSAIADPHLLEREFARLGKVELNVVREMFGLDSVPKRTWGFKEIWNGAWGVDWAIYDLVFPAATWVHLVRNPLDYACSALRWKGIEMSRTQLEVHIKRWSMMIDVSRERVSTGRFVEIRYEDLVESPQSALAPIFERLGLEFHESCMAPLEQAWAVSASPSRPVPVPVTELMESSGVLQLVDELGYAIHDGHSPEGVIKPRAPADLNVAAARTESNKLVSDQEETTVAAGRQPLVKFLILDPGDMSPDVGKAFRYWVPLLTSESDEPADPNRSDYLLTEAGEPIGEPHSLHSDIREKGGGRWSHWGQCVYFSSSDGSDPRLNGREYALVKLQPPVRAPEGVF
jgi:hypothetical protein